jgi:hypothetical protein
MEITYCRICKSKNLVEVVDLGNQTLTGRFPSTIDEEIPSYPLVLVKCMDDCGLLQLKYDLNREELYKHFYGYMSGINTTMYTHLENLIKEIEDKIRLEPNDLVIDIGSNDCTTLKFYNNNLNRVGVDPTGLQFQHLYTNGIKLVPEYFDENCFKHFQGKAKVVTSISMFYDLPDPVDFARNVKNILDTKGIWVMEQSYLPSMLNTNSFDTICHEHLEYYSLKQIEYIARKVDLQIIGLSFNDCNGGSFRVTLTHKDNLDFNFKDLNIIVETQLNESKIKLDLIDTYHIFFNKCKKLKEELLSFLTKEKSLGKKISLYGASTKGNVLLQFYGLDNILIDCVAERNVHKYGKFTPKTLIPIKSEEEVRNMNPDYMLVLPWHFKSEFIEREKKYIDKGGSLIFPLPTLTIIKKKNGV